MREQQPSFSLLIRPVIGVDRRVLPSTQLGSLNLSSSSILCTLGVASFLILATAPIAMGFWVGFFIGELLHSLWIPVSVGILEEA